MNFVKIFFSALILAMTLPFFVHAEVAEEGDGEILGQDDLVCGTYIVKGQVRNFSGGEESLVIYPGANREFELDFIGHPSLQAISYQNEIITIHARVKWNQRIQQKYLEFESFKGLAVPEEALSRPFQLLKRKDC